MPFVDTETGEAFDGCPMCEESHAQVAAMEGELRQMRSKNTRLAKLVEAQAAAKHSKKEWDAAVAAWLEVFPDVPKPRSLSVQSARCKEFFARLDHGATTEDVVNAIYGARELPLLRYGKRTATAGPATERAVDLAEICKTTGASAEANFDLLCAIGAKAREPF